LGRAACFFTKSLLYKPSLFRLMIRNNPRNDCQESTNGLTFEPLCSVQRMGSSTTRQPRFSAAYTTSALDKKPFSYWCLKISRAASRRYILNVLIRSITGQPKNILVKKKK